MLFLKRVATNAWTVDLQHALKMNKEKQIWCEIKPKICDGNCETCIKNNNGRKKNKSKSSK